MRGEGGGGGLDVERVGLGGGVGFSFCGGCCIVCWGGGG
jgi:hypothetical protein